MSRAPVRLALVAIAVLLAPSPLGAQRPSQASRPNVLFIAVDDLADWVGCLGGHPDVRTPNIDSLARRGVLFTRAHCVSPICGPSRASVLTGLRPETSGVYHNRGTYVDYVPDAVSLPAHFKQNGYHVMGAGKINHGSGMIVAKNWHEYGPGTGIVGGPFSHDELKTEGMAPNRIVRRGAHEYRLPMNGISLIDRPTNQYSTFDWGPLDMTDDEMPDGQIAKWASEQLERDFVRPFFLAVGFYRPHQPFFVPRRYFDLYDPERVALPPSKSGDLEDLSPTGQNFARLPWTSGCHRTVLKHDQWRQGVVGYLAAISFADAQVGRVIEALDGSPHADNTLIVLWSDHGWHLGEKEHWGKHTPWERSTRVPLLIVPPRSTQPRGFQPGLRSTALVSLLDLYPTLIDLCDLPPRELQGRSLGPLLQEPGQPWSPVVVTTVGRGNHSVRSQRWRYIRYFDGSEELYDLEADPHEWSNLASDPCHEERLHGLAAHIPHDERFVRFVRWGRWKYIQRRAGSPLLFDILEPHGISEQNDRAAREPAIVSRIAGHLETNRITERHVDLTGQLE